MTRLAFHAAIKPPDHPIASGDRLIAANLMKALGLAGYDVELASRFIAYSKRPEADILAARKADALQEADRIIADWQKRPSIKHPSAWITYHPYCKAPDWLGPRVAEAFDIPLITVEAARTGQGFENGGDLWANWRTEAQIGLRAADMHLAFKRDDADYLLSLGIPDERITMIAPFIEVPVNLPSRASSDPPVLLAVGQMRPGKKLRNYEILAQALTMLPDMPWRCLLVGDGPERDNIAGLFEPFGNRVTLTGAIPHDEVLQHMASASLFVWPGWKEPIGMVYLEAQMLGLPVVAFDEMGPPLVVANGETGVLTKADDVAGFAKVISDLLRDDYGRKRLSANGPAHVKKQHSLTSAAIALKTTLSAAGLAP
ncbi:glycosyltransferase family 4 protein [Ahrensia sp. R2A130]|uniref:glycosyltransferase family 4 protein n=1 Tax=Ahrensia sp. R2A130 TaxID=744979 RepID=UPI0001E0F115|nr:glycosyltransferase family 4 protein [Ahrensia sp. R2A130]EFL88058.1 glycosyl transferase group 1 [Ahrensia sp. R2A130]